MFELCQKKRYARSLKLLDKVVLDVSKVTLEDFIKFIPIRKRRRGPSLSFSIEESLVKVSSLQTKYEEPHIKKPRRSLQGESQVIPDSFIIHIEKLGFEKKDARRLYEDKADWLGLSSVSKILCTLRNCNFETKLAGDSMTRHYQSEHGWRDYPCDEDNCKFIAYSRICYNMHKAAHGRIKQPDKEFKCKIADCQASFERRGLLDIHLRIHENNVFYCRFCPFSTAQYGNLQAHERLHFGIENYCCTECEKTFSRKALLKSHFDAVHEGIKAECPLCSLRGSLSRIQTHIRKLHRRKASWSAKTQKFTVID